MYNCSAILTVDISPLFDALERVPLYFTHLFIPCLYVLVHSVLHIICNTKQGQGLLWIKTSPLFHSAEILQKYASHFTRHGLLFLSFSCPFWMKPR